jgi:hypothetical protein
MATNGMTVALVTFGVALVAFGVGACARSQDCERERLALVKEFEQVQLTAADAKKIDEARAQKMDEQAKKAHIDRWAMFENKAGLLHSAVVTEQVTWESASDTLKLVNEEYKKEPAVSAFEQGFGTALAKAGAGFEAFKTKCR